MFWRERERRFIAAANNGGKMSTLLNTTHQMPSKTIFDWIFTAWNRPDHHYLKTLSFHPAWLFCIRWKFHHSCLDLTMRACQRTCQRTCQFFFALTQDMTTRDIRNRAVSRETRVWVFPRILISRTSRFLLWLFEYIDMGQYDCSFQVMFSQTRKS